MTSIILFKLKNKLYLVGDTQHTYLHTIFQKTKIFPLIAGKFLIVGAGRDDVINGYYNQLISMESLQDCKTRIEGKITIADLNNGYNSLESDERIKKDNIGGTSFFVIDISTGKFKAFKNGNELNNIKERIEIIGSGENFIGFCDDVLKGMSDEINEQKLFKKFLSALTFLGHMIRGLVIQFFSPLKLSALLKGLQKNLK